MTGHRTRSDTEHREAAAGLALAAAAGQRGVLRLLHSHDAVDIWRAGRPTLLRWAGGREWVDRFLALRRALSPASALADAAKRGVRFVAYGEPGYAGGLARLVYPPAGLFFIGPKEVLVGSHDRPRVTIVGTRKATRYGSEVAYRLAQAFAARGVVVLSGLALGVDGQAHRGALDGGGHSLAVLGCGPDVVYPRRHRELYGRMAESGAVLSEYPPGTPPSAWSFPERNRLLAAMGDAVIVAEAPVRSGALITAQRALELGKEVFAVPGPILGGRSMGCNRLIFDGASPCLDATEAVEDFLRVTRMERGDRVIPTPRTPGDRGRGGSGVSENLAALAVASGASSVEEVAVASGLDVREASVALTMLELVGRVARCGSGGYTIA